MEQERKGIYAPNFIRFEETRTMLLSVGECLGA